MDLSLFQRTLPYEAWLFNLRVIFYRRLRFGSTNHNPSEMSIFITVYNISDFVAGFRVTHHPIPPTGPTKDTEAPKLLSVLS